VNIDQHLPRWVNGVSLCRDLNGRFESEMLDVIELPVRNRFTGQTQLEPVILLADGWRCIPSITMRRALKEMFGAETNGWKGRHIVIYLHTVTRTDKKTGEVIERQEKRVMKLEADVVSAFEMRRAR
jgi:hypothetical protein